MENSEGRMTQSNHRERFVLDPSVLSSALPIDLYIDSRVLSSIPSISTGFCELLFGCGFVFLNMFLSKAQIIMTTMSSVQ